MTIEILEDLLKHCKNNGTKLPVIIFADGFKGHYGIEIAEFCKQNRIKMIFLKPNTTHACQPLDVTVFSPLKLMIKKLSHEWHGKRENTDRKLDKYTMMKEVTWQAVEKVFSNPMTVPSGFRRSGLLPFGPENMDWHKFSSSKVYEREAEICEENGGTENVEHVVALQISNNNNTFSPPEFCGEAEDVADPIYRYHPLPPPPEVSVSQEPDVAVSVPPSSLAPAQSSVSQCLPSQLQPLPSVYQAPTEPNTPHISPQSSVSGPAVNSDIDPLIEPLPAMTVSHTAQVSSAPVPATISAPPQSQPNVSHQTLSVPLPTSATDPSSPEDIIATNLVNRQKSLTHDKKVRQLQRYEHLIDPDGDKIAEFETLYKAARFDVANTEFQNWLLYKKQSVGTESEAFDRILEQRIPKNVPLRKRKRKDNLPPGKDRYDLTSRPMIQAMQDMQERAENRSTKKPRAAKPSTIKSSSLKVTCDTSEAPFCDDITSPVQVESVQAPPVSAEDTQDELPKRTKRGRKRNETEVNDNVKEASKKSGPGAKRIMTRNR